jgi:hypothetical protein
VVIQMIRASTLFLTAALGLTISAMTALAAPKPLSPSYYYTEIARGKNFHGNYMNAFGEIAGYVDTSSPGRGHAAIYRNGTVTDLGALLNADLDSEASFINLKGEVTLITFTGGMDGFTGYIYKGNEFSPVILPTGAFMNEFCGLNDFGQAVGNFIDPTVTNGGSVSGFLLEPDGALVKLPIIPFYESGSINDFGQIVGSNRMAGGFESITLRDPGGVLVQLAANQIPVAINELGDVIGYDGPASNGYLYADGKVTNLGHLPTAPTGAYYFPTGLNDFDTVVGVIEGSGFETGFVSTNGKMYDLTAIVTPKNGFIVNFVRNILDSGQILATGGYSVPDDLERTVILTPRFSSSIKP